MKAILFTTSSCPKCPAFKDFVKENINFPVEKIDNNSADFMDKASELGISQAPTIIIFDENNQEIFRANGESELGDFLQNI